MSTPRIIKKYPNRRLYDTSISSYITLDDIKDLVMQKISFKVIDNSTEEDMTNYVLLQIITEGEAGRTPIFTTEILENIIRYYGNPLQKSMSEFLEKSLSMFSEHQGDFQSYFKDMASLTKRNMELWQSAFSQTFSPDKKPKKSKG